ncbi:MAG: type VI secretion system baseplate subunit TssG [Phycisphaerales bacterium]
MASPDGSAPQSLNAQLAAQPYNFDFFAALRRLECQHANLPRLGKARRPRAEAIRLGQTPSLAFAPATLSQFIDHVADGGDSDQEPLPSKLLVYFFGLLGPNGPMPLHFTEFVRDRQLHEHDSTIAGFLDLFHHRMMSLFYRAWAESHPTVSYDRREDDRFSTYIGSLIGIGSSAFRNRDALQDDARLHFTGRLGPQARNPEGLEAILADFFQVPVRIAQYMLRWIRLPGRDHCRIGSTPASVTLGSTAIVGRRFLDCMQTFRIVMGPLSLADYGRFLPIGPSSRRLRDWVRTYSGEWLRWELQLVLRREEVPQTQLGNAGRLGWTTWLKTRPFQNDADDLVLQTHVA